MPPATAAARLAGAESATRVRSAKAPAAAPAKATTAKSAGKKGKGAAAPIKSAAKSPRPDPSTTKLSSAGSGSATKSRTADKSSQKKTAKRRSGKAGSPAKPRYLAAELGQPTDHRGEPLGASSARAASDEDLQKYALQLWRQMQSGRVVNRYSRAIERAGLTIDEVWTAGLGEMRMTSSTADEIRRYRQKILFRANLLEAIFAETIADLRRLDGIEPGDAPEREPA